MKKSLKNLLIVVLVFVFALTAIHVFAQQQGPTSGANPQNGPQAGGTTIKIENPFGKANNLMQLLETILNDAVLPIGGIAVTVMIIYSGFLFVTARGNEEKLKNAKRAFLYTAIGSAILLGAVALAKIIGSTINALK